MKMTLLGGLFLIGCGGDARPAPSCFDAFSHYYAAGCTLVDLNTGQQVSQGTVIAQCQTAAANEPANCRDEFDAFLSCINASTPAQQCNCSSDQMTLLQCR
jgi:hypothetical protein